MPLYRPQSPLGAAQAAMSNASQTAAAQTKQTVRTTKKDESFWDQFYKGTAGVANLARGIGGLMDVAEDAYELYDTAQQRGSYDLAAKTFQEGGFDALQSSPELQDYRGQQAIGKLMLDRANSGKGRLEMMKNLEAANDKQYLDWRVQATTVQQAFNSGDMRQFMPAMRQLIERSPLPYKLEPDGGGNFKVMFRSDAKGGWADTGKTMTPQEAMAQVNGVMRGEQMILRGIDGKTMPVNPEFQAAAARYQYATMVGNAQNRIDPKKQIPFFDRNGNQAGVGIIQNPIDDYSAGSRLLVFSKNGEQVGTFDGMDGAMQAGYSPYAAKKGGGAGGSAGRGGAGGQFGFGPKKGGLAHIAMLERGFLWDDKNQWYFNAELDADGKQRFGKAASMEDFQEALNRAGYAHGIGGTGASGGGDSFRLRPQKQEGQQLWRTQPHIPEKPGGSDLLWAPYRQKQKAEQNPAYSGASASPLKEGDAGLINYTEYGVTKWAIIRADGSREEVTPDEAKAYARERKKAEDSRSREQREQRAREFRRRHYGDPDQVPEKPTGQVPKRMPGGVTINEAWPFLTQEEREVVRKTGKLPSGYRQIR